MRPLWLAGLLLVACSDPSGMDQTTQIGWRDEQKLSTSGGTARLSYNFARSVAADETNAVHVVWYDARFGTSRIYYRHSTDNGASWQAETQLSSHDALASEHPAIAITGNHVYVVWHEARPERSDVVMRRSTDRGHTWQPAVVLSTTGKSAHSSIAASGANVHIVWGDVSTGNAEIHARHSTDGGVTWSADQLISETPFESWVPTVAARGNIVLIGWVDYRDGNEEEYLRRSADGGRTWSAIQRLTNNDADSWAPSLAITAAGTAHIVWFDRRDIGITDAQLEAEIDELLRLMGETPEPRPPRDPAHYYLQDFGMRVERKVQHVHDAAPGWVERGGDGKVLEARFNAFKAAFNRWATGWEIYAKRSSDGGITWGPDTRLTDAPLHSARPSIAVDGQNLYVVWFDARDGQSEIYVKQSADDGRTWQADERLTNAAGESVHASVAANTSGVHVVWFDERFGGGPEIYYRRKGRADSR